MTEFWVYPITLTFKVGLLTILLNISMSEFSHLEVHPLNSLDFKDTTYLSLQHKVSSLYIRNIFFMINLISVSNYTRTVPREIELFYRIYTEEETAFNRS